MFFLRPDMPSFHLLPAVLLIAALLAPAVSAATLVVAAADASAADRAAADLRCDGVADQREINDAFNLLPDDVGTVRLTAGTFNCSESIFPNGELRADRGRAGRDADRGGQQRRARTKPISVTQPDVHLRGFTLMGNGGVIDQGEPGRGRGGDRDEPGARRKAVPGRRQRHVLHLGRRRDDRGRRVHRLHGRGRAHPRLQPERDQPAARDPEHPFHQLRRAPLRLRRRGRLALGVDRPASTSRRTTTSTTSRSINCRAEDNWQSGFHFEPGEDKGTIKKAITFQGCTAERNGQRNPTPYPYTSTFLSGFYVHFNAAVTDCASVDNKNAGFYVEGGDNVVFTRCTDRDSTYGWKVVKNARNIRLEDCTSTGAEKWAFWSAFATNITLARFRQVDARRRTRATSPCSGGTTMNRPTSSPVTGLHLRDHGLGQHVRSRDHQPGRKRERLPAHVGGRDDHRADDGRAHADADGRRSRRGVLALALAGPAAPERLVHGPLDRSPDGLAVGVRGRGDLGRPEPVPRLHDRGTEDREPDRQQHVRLEHDDRVRHVSAHPRSRPSRPSRGRSGPGNRSRSRTGRSGRRRPGAGHSATGGRRLSATRSTPTRTRGSTRSG